MAIGIIDLRGVKPRDPSGLPRSLESPQLRYGLGNDLLLPLDLVEQLLRRARVFFDHAMGLTALRS